MEKGIYLDHAATTYVDDRVVKEMIPYFSEIFGNPGSLHTPGLAAKEAIDRARKTIAKILYCKQSEIIFTGGGTESLNLAIKGVAFNKKKGHIITSKVEHSAVLEICAYLETHGFDVTYVEVDQYGKVNPEDVKNAIRDDTILISIMYANNEIGTIEPIRALAKIAKERKVLFHTDACQAAGSLDINVESLGVDLMTINGSKIYGPKGVGILYRRKGIELDAVIHGGGQEYNLRGGTENVSGIVGFAKALELAHLEQEEENKRLVEMRDHLIHEVLTKIPKSFLNGHPTERLPNNANLAFLDVEGESILLYLNEKGIYLSTGSACTSRNLEISHVLDAIGLNHDAAHGSMRFSLGKRTTMKDIETVLKILPEVIQRLRSMSPVTMELNQIREEEKQPWNLKRKATTMHTQTAM